MDQLANLTIEAHFGTLDWAIIIVFLVGSTIAGLWAMRYIRDVDDYVVAGRSVRTYLGIASMVASELGLVTVMYSAQKGFVAGFSAFAIAALSALAGLAVGLTGFIVVPLRKMGVMTIPEFYERRFSPGVRVTGAVILAASGILNMGMFLYADSLFVTSVMGMNDPTTLKWAMTILLGLVLLYTMLGGMVAVLFTDYLQYCVMAVGLVFTSVLLMSQFGWGGVVDKVMEIKGEAGINPLVPENGMGASYMVWMLFLGLISACVWQTSVMRATSAESEKVVRRTYAWGSVGFLVRFIIPYFWGICALIFVHQTPELKGLLDGLTKASEADPTNGQLAKQLSEVQLRAMPIALSNLIPAGLIGLLTAGMLAAAMSTYNTYLHTWSAVLSQDVVAPVTKALTGRDLPGKTRIMWARGIMCFVAFFLLVWGLWYPLSQDLWDYMAVTGAVYFTGAFATLVGGLYWKRASKAGAYGAFICGFLMILGLTPLQKALGVDWPSQWVGITVAGLALGAMFILSIVFPDDLDKAERGRRAVKTVAVVAAMVALAAFVHAGLWREGWTVIWFGSLAIFSVLTVMVIFYGGHDLAALLRSLRIRHHEELPGDAEAEAADPEEK